MDQRKIGKFIGERRKAAGLTQMQLAEKLDITDRAVSKWETGKTLPDTSLMLKLCKILDISVNDLMSGEMVAKADYSARMEQNLLELAAAKELSDKHLLSVEVYLLALLILMVLGVVYVIGLESLESWVKILVGAAGTVVFLIGAGLALRIEQIAGYYECAKCKHRYTPSYASVFFAQHMGRTRKMRCPKCGKKSWQKKVLVLNQQD